MDDFNDLKRIWELNPGVIVREADLSDGKHFVALFNMYYKRKTSIDYFKWQFFNSPYRSKLYTAFNNNELIGYYGIKLHPLTIGITSGFAIDFLIHESYRKKGIGYLLNAEVVKLCKQNNVSVLTALPNAKGNAAFKALGWRSIAKVDTLVYDNNEGIYSSHSSFEKQIEETLLIEFEKNNQYTEWRFKNNPLHNYDTIVLDDKTSAITKLFIDPIYGKVYGDIVNITNRQPLEKLKLLLEKVLWQLKTKGVDTVTTWALPHTNLNSLFINAGFRILPQERFFCLKLMNSTMEKLTQIKNWNLVQCDAEIY